MGKWVFGLKSLKALSERGLASQELPSGVPFDYALAWDLIPRLLGASFPGTDLSLDGLIEEIGGKWVRDHVAARHRKTPYLRALPQGEVDYDLHRLRVTDLAELLYNLQTVTGIDPIYRRIVDDPSKIEATVLELEGFRLLWLAGLSFKVVHTGAGESLNYDCEIALPSGTTAYCEMKCKIETTAYSENSLANALRQARAQLPKPGCGIILVKFPQSWVDGPQEMVDSINSTIRDFLRNTTRVSEVAWYARLVKYSGEWGFPLITFNEYLNDRSPYVEALGRGLLHRGLQHQTGWVHLSGITREGLQQLLAAALESPR